jgi:hypothetical protein
MSDDKKRPGNLRANEVPRDGFVLSVDGVLKARYETLAEATTAGSNLKKKFPVIHVEVFDATAQKYLQLT